MKLLVAIPKGEIRDTFIPADIADKLGELGDVLWNDGVGHWTGEELADRLRGAEVCVTGWGDAFFDETVLRSADRLNLVAHTGGSVASTVGKAFFDRGLRIASGNRLFAESVAEGVVGYMLCALRDLPRFAGEVQQGRWRSETYHNEGLLDRRVGLVGFGMVARYLTGMLRPFRCAVSAYDPYVPDDVLGAHGVRRAPLGEILSESDIISLHAAKTPGSRHLITAAHLKNVRDGALFVNTARGSIVDEAALARELAAGRFRAVLDVFEEEPLPADSGLRGLPNAILIPHMAGPTVDRRKHVTLALIEDIRAFAEGRPMQNEIGREYALAMTR